MRNERLLYVGGWLLLHGLNHASRHWAAYLEKRFKHVDSVGFDNFYSGPPAPPWIKIRRGLFDLSFSRIKISMNGSARRIVIRDLYAPHPLKLMVKELWRYINLRQVLTPPYDLAIFGDPENAWLAWLLKRSGRVKRLIYQDWDYHPGMWRNWFGQRMIENRERLCVRQADAVITGNSLLARLRMQQGAKQVMVLPYGVNLSLFASARQKVPHPPTLVYLGTLSPLWGVDLAIRALPALLHSVPDVRLLIAGRGPAEADLRALSQKLGLAERVCFLGRLEYEALPAVLAEADVGVLTSVFTSKFRYYATPVKLVDYMAAGLPVIATRMGQQEIMMREAEAGMLIDYSVEEFVAAAVSLLSDERIYERCSQAAITYAAHFDWNLLLDQGYQYLLDILSSNQSPNAAIVSAELVGDILKERQ